jgi:hypothetical protein
MRRLLAAPLCALVVLGLAANGSSQYIDLERVSYEVPKGCTVEKGYEWIVKLPGEGGEVTIKDQNSQLDETGIMGRALKEYQAHLRSIQFPSIQGPYRWLTAQDYDAIVWWVKSQPESQDVDKVSNTADWRAIVAAPQNSYIELQARLSGDVDKLIPLLEELINSITYGPTPSTTPTKVDWDAVSEKLPYPLWPPKSDPDELAAALAGIILASEDPTQALLLAFKRSGFYVKDSKGETIVEPERGKGIGLFANSLEVHALADMHVAGITLDLASALDSLDFLISKIAGIQINVSELVRKIVEKDYNGSEPHARFMARLIVELGRQMEEPYDLLSDFLPDSAELLPIQYFLINRTLSESLRYWAIRNTPGGLIEPEDQTLYAGPTEHQVGKAFKPYAEDFATYSSTSAVSLAMHQLEQALRNSGSLIGADSVGFTSIVMSAANAVASIAKFVAMYASVEGKIRLEKPRLRRTTSTTEDGEYVGASVTFRMNPNLAIRSIKDLRLYLAPFGIDIDMPKAGPLAGVETEWKWNRGGLKAAEYEPIVAYDGRVDKVVTDATGKAQVRVKGLRQKERLQESFLVPVTKHATLSVTPQLKSNDIKQAILDIAQNAIGIGLSGPFGFLGPVFETIYRMKFGYAALKRLQVIDWENVGIALDLNVSIAGEGTVRRRDYSGNWKVSRQAKVEAAVLAVPTIGMSEDALNRAMMLHKRRYQEFRQLYVKKAEVTVNDVIFEEGQMIDCETEKAERFARTTTYTAPPIVRKRDPSAFLENASLLIDWERKKYQLELPAIGSALLMTEVEMQQRSTSASGTSISTKKHLFVQNHFDVHVARSAQTDSYDLSWSDDDTEEREPLRGSKTLTADFRGWGPVELKYEWTIYYVKRERQTVSDPQTFFERAALTAPRTYDESFDQIEYEQAPTCWMPTVRPKPLPTVLEALIHAIFRPYVPFGSH